MKIFLKWINRKKGRNSGGGVAVAQVGRRKIIAKSASLIDLGGSAKDNTRCGSGIAVETAFFSGF